MVACSYCCRVAGGLRPDGERGLGNEIPHQIVGVSSVGSNLRGNPIQICPSHHVVSDCGIVTSTRDCLRHHSAVTALSRHEIQLVFKLIRRIGHPRRLTKIHCHRRGFSVGVIYKDPFRPNKLRRELVRAKIYRNLTRSCQARFRLRRNIQLKTGCAGFARVIHDGIIRAYGQHRFDGMKIYGK